MIDPDYYAGNLPAAKKLIFGILPGIPITFCIVDFYLYGFSLHFIGFLGAAIFAILFLNPQIAPSARNSVMLSSMLAATILIPLAQMNWGHELITAHVLGMAFSYAAFGLWTARKFSALNFVILLITPFYQHELTWPQLTIFIILYLNITAFAEWCVFAITTQKKDLKQSNQDLKKLTNKLKTKQNQLQTVNNGYHMAMEQLDASHKELLGKTDDLASANSELTSLNIQYSATIEALEDMNEKLRRAQTMSQTYMENARSAIVIRNAQLQVQEFNGAADLLYSALGLDLSVGSSVMIADANPQIAKVHFDQKMDWSMTNRIVGTYSVDIAWTNGNTSHYSLDVRKVSILSEAYLMLSWTDVTNIVQAHKRIQMQSEAILKMDYELLESREMSMVFIQASRNPIVVVDQESKIQALNDAGRELFSRVGLTCEIGEVCVIEDSDPEKFQFHHSLDATKADNSMESLPDRVTFHSPDHQDETYKLDRQTFTANKKQVFATTFYDITDVLQLKTRQAELTTLFENQSVPCVVWKLDEVLTMAYTNQAYLHLNNEILTSDSIAGLIGKPFDEVFQPHYVDQARANFKHQLALLVDGKSHSMVLPEAPHHKGHRYQIEYSTVSLSETNDDRYIVLNFIDVTEREQERHLAETLLNRISSMVLTQNEDWKILSCSDAWEEQMGYTREETIGHDLHEFIKPEERQIAIDDRKVLAATEAEQCKRGQLTIVTKAGDERRVELSTVIEDGREDRMFIVTLVDITDSENARNELERKLLFDDLTGVLSRRGITARYEALPSDQKHVVFLLDLDHFKSVNDTYGHDAGDRLLQKCGEILRDMASKKGFAGRLGGEEFVVVEPFESWEATENAAEAIRKALEGVTVRTREGSINRTASVGVALIDDDKSLSDTLAVADAALDEAKQAGRNQVALATPTYLEKKRAEGGFVTEWEIRGALENNEMYYVVQPIMDVYKNQIAGFEALIRWQRPDGTMIPPQTVSAKLAEVTKDPDYRRLKWNLRRGLLKQLSYFDSSYVSFNHRVEELSSPSSADRIIESFEYIRDTEQRRFVIELSERSLTERVDMNTVITNLNRVQDAGILIALDDFGVESSNLHRLTQLPIDIIKLDKFLVQRIENDLKAREVVRSTAIMASKLNIRTIAEGVETPDQAKLLFNMRNIYQQGYIHARPLKIEQLFEGFTDIGYEITPDMPEGIATSPDKVTGPIGPTRP